MALTEEQIKIIEEKTGDKTIAESIRKQSAALDEVTQESIGRKTKIREYEAKEKKTIADFAEKEKVLQAKLDKIKEAGLDPDGELEDQINAKLDELREKKSLRPSAEVDKIKLDWEKTKAELKAEREARAASDKARELQQVSSDFLPVLSEQFSKTAKLILHDIKERLTLKNGVSGITKGDEFYPLKADEGEVSAIDILKKEYADYVEVKQKGGSGGGGKGDAVGGEDGEKTMTLAEFEGKSPAEKNNLVEKIKKGELKLT